MGKNLRSLTISNIGDCSWESKLSNNFQNNWAVCCKNNSFLEEPLYKCTIRHAQECFNGTICKWKTLEANQMYTDKISLKIVMPSQNGVLQKMKKL